MKRKYILLGHILFWILFLLKDLLLYQSNYSRAPVDRMVVIPTAYLLIILTAFYGGYGLIYTWTIQPGRRQIGKGLLAVLLTLGLIVIVRYLVEFGFMKPLLQYDNYEHNDHFTWLWFMQNAILYYWSWVLYGVLYGFTEHYVQQQQREREQVKAEISLLRAQVNPHFLFNTLNDIYALALTHSPQTPDALMKLSDLLRYMLYSAQTVSVPLADELAYVKSYIDLEQIGQKGLVNVQTSFTGIINGHRIAPMILIPFVENAFKHGVLFEPSQAITIRLTGEADSLLFCCRNAKRRGEKDQTGGIGLLNLCRRLDLEYPGRYTLTINDTDGQFDVKLQLTF